MVKKKNKNKFAKHPTSNYLLFRSKRLNDFKEENKYESLTIQEKTKKISQEWRSLDPGEKQIYTDIFQIEQKKYHKHRNKIMKEKKNKPPKSAYHLFIKEQLPIFKKKNQNLPHKKVFRLVVDEWNKQKEEKANQAKQSK